MQQADIAADFPHPLTDVQRRDLFHVAQSLTSGCEKLSKALGFIERDLSAAVLKHSNIEAELLQLLDVIPPSSITTKRERNEENSLPTIVVDAASSPPPSKSRLKKGSAMFTSLKGFLSNAQKDQEERQCFVSQRVAVQRANKRQSLQSELEFMAASVVTLKSRHSEVSSKLDVLQAQRPTVELILTCLEREEREYCLSFFLSAAGGDDEGGSPYNVYFCPAVHSEETKMMALCQVTEAATQYATFREIVDPILVKMENDRAASSRAKQLQKEDDCQIVVMQGDANETQQIPEEETFVPDAGKSDLFAEELPPISDFA